MQQSVSIGDLVLIFFFCGICVIGHDFEDCSRCDQSVVFPIKEMYNSRGLVNMIVLSKT